MTRALALSVGGNFQVVFVAACNCVREGVNRLAGVVDDFQDGLGFGCRFLVQLVVGYEVEIVVDVPMRSVNLSGDQFQWCLR